jgi:hypothetical protein
MSAHLPTKVQLDALLPQLQAYTRSWADRECASFDDAVLRETSGEGSIWDMPAIDSKRAVGLLVELEAVIGGGCKIPVSVITSGGYASPDDLVTKLFAKVREICPDIAKPGVTAVAAPVAASQPPPKQVSHEGR